jgi:hypothetical protein
MNQENLGPAERIIQTLISYTDHMNHGRPGVVCKDQTGLPNRIASVEQTQFHHRI